MLLFYILRHFYTRFAVSFGILLFVLTMADLLMRLSSVQSIALVAPLFICALPVISLFAMPIAASLAVQTTIGQWQGESAEQLFRFFGGMRRELVRALAIFACSLGVLYLPLVFDLAPRSAKAARSMVLGFAKEHVKGLEPGTFHQLAPGSMVYFRAKETGVDGSVLFKNILLHYADAKGRHTVSAQEGYVAHDRLSLSHGSMHNQAHGKKLHVSFGRMHIDLDRLIGGQQQEPSKSKPLRVGHPTWGELFSQMGDGPVSVEFHARLVRLLWLLVFPFLALAGMLWWGARMRLVGSIAWSCGLFLLSYILISLGRVLCNAPLLAGTVLYGSGGLISWFLFTRARGRW